MKILLTLLMIGAAFLPLAAQSDSPRIWWTFDEIADGKINNSNADYPAALNLVNVGSAPGRKGNAACFKGKNSFAFSRELAREMALSGERAWTISFWIKPETLERRQKYELISKGKDRGPGWRLYLSYGMLTFRIGGEESQNIEPVAIHTSENKVKFVPDKWYNICMTRDDGGILTIYVNGIEMVGSEKKINIYPDYKTAFFLGNMQGKFYQYEGLIDEFKFYDRALTAVEILKEANPESMLFEKL